MWLLNVTDYLKGSVGERAAGTDLYLSNGDEGEILTRSPIMFSKYVSLGSSALTADTAGIFTIERLPRIQWTRMVISKPEISHAEREDIILFWEEHL